MLPHQCLTLTSILSLRYSRSATQLYPPPFGIVPLISSSLSLFLRPSYLLSSPLLPLSRPLLSPLSLSLRRYFRPLGLSAAVCLPIIFPSPSSPLQRPSFFSMSTNNSLPFYPYFLFRFSPAYSKTAESPLFPSHVYALVLSHSSSELRRFLPLFPVASIKAAVSKPIGLRPTLSCTRSRFFPLHGFFSRCYCRLSNASQFAMADFPQLRNGNFNT